MTIATKTRPRWIRCSRRTLFVATFMTCAATAAYSSADDATEQVELPREVTITIESTSGKPDGPTESISLKKRREKYTLSASRRSAEKILAEATVEVAQEDFAEVWKLIETAQLMKFIPEVDKAIVIDDFGDRYLHIETVDPARTLHVIQWMRPLRNGDCLRAPIKALEGLVVLRIPSVKLYYLRPTANVDG